MFDIVFNGKMGHSLWWSSFLFQKLCIWVMKTTQGDKRTKNIWGQYLPPPPPKSGSYRQHICSVCYMHGKVLLGVRGSLRLNLSTKYKTACISVIVSLWAAGVTSKRMLVNTQSYFQISPENRQLWQMDKCSEMFVYTDIFQHRK